MKRSKLVYYGCVGTFGGMMAACGHDITTLPFWIGLLLIIIAHSCGEAFRDETV